jgi:hypothetical protein
MIKGMMKEGHAIDYGDDDHEAKLENELTKGGSLASKVMEDLFKK